MFAEQGFVHSTMRDVADRAGILPGSLYHHFTSKDEILVELMESFNDDVLHDLTEVVDPAREPIDNLVAMIDLAVTFVVRRSDESKILLNEYAYVSSTPALAGVAEGYRRSAQIWIEVLRAAQRRGQLRPEMDVRVAFASLMGSIFSSGRFSPSGRLPDRADVADQLASILVDGLRRRTSTGRGRTRLLG